MARKRYKPDEIVSLLRQAEVLHGQGMSMADAIRQLGVSEVTYYRWRKEYGGMSGDQLRRLKELEKENERLRRAVSDLTLDKQILKEAARGNFFSIRGLGPQRQRRDRLRVHGRAVRAGLPRPERSGSAQEIRGRRQHAGLPSLVMPVHGPGARSSRDGP